MFGCKLVAESTRDNPFSQISPFRFSHPFKWPIAESFVLVDHWVYTCLDVAE